MIRADRVVSQPKATDSFCEYRQSGCTKDIDGDTAKKLEAMQGIMRLHFKTHFDCEFDMLEEDWHMVDQHEGGMRQGDK